MRNEIDYWKNREPLTLWIHRTLMLLILCSQLATGYFACRLIALAYHALK